MWRACICALACLAVASLTLLGRASADTTSLPGRLLFVKDGDLWVWEGDASRTLATGGAWSQPSWSPDGANLAYVYRGTNFSDIFVTDARGEAQTRLTASQSSVLDDNDWNFRPAWSPDGSLIAFVSDRKTVYPTLWLMNAVDGTRLRAVPTPGVIGESLDCLSWAPDGERLAVTLFGSNGPSQVAIVPVDPSLRESARVLTDRPSGALDPAWSPDGGWIAYAGRDGHAIELFASRTDDSEVVRFTSDGVLTRAPTWSPDGQHLAFLSNKTGWFELWVLDISFDASGSPVASAPRQLTQNLHLDATSGLAWGP
jgi:TolB protein